MFAKIFKRRRREVKLDVVRAIELRKDADYILIADAGTMDQKSMQQIMKDIRKAGINRVVGFLLSGDPDDAIQTVNVKRKSNATKQTRH